ncbi:MAG TPA: hypothetical protein VLI39_18355 [Sedimentisphaerales bacterium]|nr:hypothetical protein [Sedimentisphaerales bacterium]
MKNNDVDGLGGNGVGIDQVNTAMAQMDKATQQNAAHAEESAGASGELSVQAESMKEVVGNLVALVGEPGLAGAVRGAPAGIGGRRTQIQNRHPRRARRPAGIAAPAATVWTRGPPTRPGSGDSSESAAREDATSQAASGSGDPGERRVVAPISPFTRLFQRDETPSACGNAPGVSILDAARFEPLRIAREEDTSANRPNSHRF